MLLSGWGLWAYAVLQLASPAARPTELVAGAALVVVGLLAVAVAARLTAGRSATVVRLAHRRAAALRRRPRRLPRLIDPDAAGHARPRAPGGGLPAA